MKRTKKKTAGGLWVSLVVVAVFIVAIVAFAFQTWGLVDTIFPADNLFMKVATVMSLDVMSVIFAAAEMFYPFLNKSTKHLAFGMWIITFICALIASCIYMYLSSLHVLNGVLDARWLALAYAVVILAMSLDIVAITSGIRMEWNAAHPDDDDDDYEDEEWDEPPTPHLPVRVLPRRPQAKVSVGERIAGAFNALRGGSEQVEEFEEKPEVQALPAGSSNGTSVQKLLSEALAAAVRSGEITQETAAPLLQALEDQ